MDHAEFTRIITGFEQQTENALAEAEETKLRLKHVSDMLADARAQLGVLVKERDEARDALGSAAHRVAAKIAEACEHIHDADFARKTAFLDCARIARGVHL